MMKQKEIFKTAYIIFASILLGTILGNLSYLGDKIIYDARYFPNGLEEYSIGAVMNLPVEQLTIYIVKCRMGQLFLLVLGTLITSYGIAVGIYSLIFGIFYGMAMCNFLIQYGIIGTGYGILCFFPHFLFYFFAMYLCGKWFFDYGNRNNMYYGNVKTAQYFFKFFVIFFLIFISLIWEIKFQKNILKFFYQYLV